MKDIQSALSDAIHKDEEIIGYKKRIAGLEAREEKAHWELAQYEAIITEAIYDDSPASLTRYHKIINKLIALYHANQEESK